MQNMQKKLFPIFSIVLLLISLVAPGIQPVAAEEMEDRKLEDGSHSITAKALHADEDKASGAASFISEDAKLIVNGEEIKLSITVPHNDMAEIEGLQIEGNNPETNEKDENGSTIYIYKLNELKEILNARTQYVVPALNMDHDVPLRFKLEGLEDIPVVEPDNGAEDGDESEGDKEAEDGDESEGDKEAEDGDESEGDKDAEDGDESEGDKDTDGGDESEDNTGTETVEKKIYEDGKFDLDFSVDVSAMNRFMEKPAKTEINEGTNEVTLRFNSQQFIANFEIEKEGKLVEAQKKQIDDDYVDYTFTVDNLDEPLASKVTVDTGRTIMPHEFNINFDTSNLKEVKLDHEDLADGTYSINYDLLHASEDKASSAANYLVRPAQLKVVDGEKTVYFQITDHEAIKDFKVEQNGKLVSSKIVKVNENANSRQVAIEVDDLAEELETQFSVFIPAMGYEANPYARLQFDTDSIKKSDGKLPEVSFAPEKLEEGQAYEMNMRVLTEDGFEKSPVGSYIKMPIDLTVDKGKNMALLTLLNSDEVKDFKIKKNDNSASTQLMSLSNLSKITQDDYQSVPVIKVDEKNGERIIALEVDDLDGQVEALVSIDNDGEVTDHFVRLFFEENSIRDSEGLPVEDLDEVETPVNPEPDYTEEYDLDYTFFEKGKDNKSSMDGFKKGPAKIKEDKDGNYLVTMEFTSGNMIEYIKVNDVEADVVKEYKEDDVDIKVFEIELKDLTKNYDVKVFVNAGIYSKEHEVDLVFGEEPEPEGTSKKAASGDPTPVNGNDTLNVETSNVSKGSQVSIKMPANLPEDTEMTVEVLEKDSSVPKEYKIAGAIIDVTVVSKEELKDGKYTLTLPYNKDKFKANEVGIYYYDADNKSWVFQEGGKVDSNAGTITLEVDGFSKYGVLAETEKEEPKPDPNPEYIKEYDLGYTFYEKGKDNKSSMDGFKKGPAKVKEDKDGNYLVTMEFTSGEMIEYLKINDVDAKVVKEYKEKDVNIKAFEVKLKDLTKKHDVKVFVDAGIYSKEHAVDLVFDETGTPPKPEPKPTPKPRVEPTKGEKGDGKGKGKSKKDKVENYNFFTIDYNFYKPGTTETSVMQDFTEKGPALIRENKKNGNYNVTMTFTNGDMIKEFEVNGNSATVIKNEKGNKTFDFVVKDLDEIQKVKAKVDVPGLYSETYEVDLVFDLGSKKKLDEKDLPGWLKEYIESLTVGQSGSGGSGGTPTPDPVPDFDRDADGNIIGSNGDSGSGINPKTADLNMTQIMLFGSLLLLSLIPLVIKLRRRFVTEE